MPSVTLVFALCLVAGFVAVRFFAQRFFREPRRADVVAAIAVVAVGIGVAFDPFRSPSPLPPAAPEVTGIVALPSPSTAASVASAATPGDSPATAALFRAELVSWQRGTVAPAAYTQRGFAASRLAVNTQSPGLRALGTIERQRFISAHAAGALTGYEYRFECEHGSVNMGAYVDAAGKIDSVGFAVTRG